MTFQIRSAGLACLLFWAGCWQFLMPNYTKHTPQEFQQFRTKELAGYKETSQRFRGDLANPEFVTVNVKGGTCARMLFERGEKSAYADGLKNIQFISRRADSSNEYLGLPGLHGPGGVAMLGCYRNDTPIYFAMADQSNDKSLGVGEYTLSVYSRVATTDEIDKYEYQEVRQNEVKAEMAAEAARKEQESAAGCSACQAQWHGCIGAGRARSTCDSEFSSCGFQKVGPSYLSSCKRPN